MTSFDNLAQGWDTPDKVARANKAAQAILRLLPSIKDTNALEFGGGTALLSQALQTKVKKISIIDRSEAMVNQIRSKIAKFQYHNMEVFHADIRTFDANGALFGLVYSLLTLHHIDPVSEAFNRVSAIQEKGSYLVNFDLYPEDGSFHNHNDGTHLGFSSEYMDTELAKAGYKQLFYETAFVITKPRNGSELVDYPVFISVAEKL
ncbi:MAG: class I SAM-dependent methyltransferase [Salinivirgaceae bacterium]|nr:class I SAM-dependent methyltransferase [Salinivirgaceae bacterium]MDD4747832.1 class I SAM-dependent methyltransferase [Salinivirgaceae bacterium]MDY0281560.1 class I SAM-dependent methyltransferase [Salinivirgaceae bacterium]